MPLSNQVLSLDNKNRNSLRNSLATLFLKHSSNIIKSHTNQNQLHLDTGKLQDGRAMFFKEMVDDQQILPTNK